MIAASNKYLPQMSLFGMSDPGLKRSNNEDAFIALPEIGLCVVADGMGGASAGELASRIFAETASEVFSGSEPQFEQEVVDVVQKAFQLANERILNHTKENPEHKGMGCTAEILTFYNENIILGHVGDSRTYVFRKDALKQLTKDHSLVQDQIDQGLINRSEARRHPLRHVILRVVGVQESLAVDIVRGKAMSGDLFLLSSDGLTDMVDDTSIQEALSSSLSLSQKGEKLVALANAAGGYDNITVTLCEIGSFQKNSAD
jgi:protein phosphatase